MKFNKVTRVILILIVLTMIASFNVCYAAGIDGTTIVLNPGHGGEWTGCANGEKGLVEKNITLKIAKYLETELNKYYGVKVILTHDGTKFPNDDAGDLAARAMIARNNNADLYVSLHIDDAVDRSMNGASVYVTSRTELPKYKEGMTRLGNMILDNLGKLGIAKSKLGLVNNKLCNDQEPKYQYYDGSQADYYGDIRHCMKGDTDGLGPNFSDGSGIPAVLIEHCYMNNEHDVQFIDSDEDLKKLAKADADAIVKYLDLKLDGTVIDTLEVDKELVNLLLGENDKVTITEIGPKSVTNKKVTWKSMDEKIATVDQNGNITTVGEGRTTITVTSDNNPNMTRNITVNVEKEKLEIGNDTVNLLTDKEKYLSVKVSPSWKSSKDIEWISSAPDIVSVDNTGKIKALKEGKATITASFKDKSLSDSVEVNSVKLADNTKWEIKKYSEKDNKITKIGPNVSTKDFLKNVDITDNLKVTIEPVDKEQTLIGTGTKVIISEKSHDLPVDEYECLIYGDVNGDGQITPADYVKIKNHIMNVTTLTDLNYKAADVNRDNTISPADYVKVKNHIMKVSTIEL